MTYIDTNSLWDEMSGIANQALSDIEDVLNDSGEKEIPTSYGTISYNEDEEDVMVTEDGEETPLREYSTYDILNVAEEINDYFSNKE